MLPSKPTIHQFQCMLDKSQQWPGTHAAYDLWAHNLGLCCQKHVSQAGISNCIPQFCVGCNYLSLPEIRASGTKVINWNLAKILVNLIFDQRIQSGHRFGHVTALLWKIGNIYKGEINAWNFVYHHTRNTPYWGYTPTIHNLKRCLAVTDDTF